MAGTRTRDNDDDEDEDEDDAALYQADTPVLHTGNGMYHVCSACLEPKWRQKGNGNSVNRFRARGSKYILLYQYCFKDTC